MGGWTLTRRPDTADILPGLLSLIFAGLYRLAKVLGALAIVKRETVIRSRAGFRSSWRWSRGAVVADEL
jgi:hypothetical protein